MDSLKTKSVDDVRINKTAYGIAHLARDIARPTSRMLFAQSLHTDRAISHDVARTTPGARYRAILSSRCSL